MGAVYKILGQSNPAANTETTLYTANGVGTVISSISVCNFGSTPNTFNVVIAPGGAATSNAMYLYNNVMVAAYDTFIATIGITVSNNGATADTIKILSPSPSFSFNLFGQENY